MRQVHSASPWDVHAFFPAVDRRIRQCGEIYTCVVTGVLPVIIWDIELGGRRIVDPCIPASLENFGVWSTWLGENSNDPVAAKALSKMIEGATRPPHQTQRIRGRHVKLESGVDSRIAAAVLVVSAN